MPTLTTQEIADLDSLWAAYERNEADLTRMGHWLRLHYPALRESLAQPSAERVQHPKRACTCGEPGAAYCHCAPEPSAERVTVPKEPTLDMIDAGRLKMPVEVRYWQQYGALHAEMLPLNECVNPATVYRAMIAAAPSPQEPTSDKRDAEHWRYLKANAPAEGAFVQFRSDGHSIIWGKPDPEEPTASPQAPVAWMKVERQFHEYEGSDKQDTTGYLVTRFTEHKGLLLDDAGWTRLYASPVSEQKPCTYPQCVSMGAPCRAECPPVSEQKDEARLWLWRNFVDGRPEYWAFDNPYPCFPNGDPMTLGEPCGYAIVKQSTRGRNDTSDDEVIAAIRRALQEKPHA